MTSGAGKAEEKGRLKNVCGESYISPVMVNISTELCPWLLVVIYRDDELAVASQEYCPASDMLRGLSVSVEMNGDLILVTEDIITRSLEATGVHCTSTVTSVSTVSGSVTVQIRVCEVPSYSGPLGTLRSRVGVGTKIKIYKCEEESWICITIHKVNTHNTYI